MPSARPSAYVAEIRALQDCGGTAGRFLQNDRVAGSPLASAVGHGQALVDLRCAEGPRSLSAFRTEWSPDWLRARSGA
jgi:hypothetical protein